MIRPQALKTDEPLTWSTGTGADVWEMFCAAIAGDVESLQRLLDKDPQRLGCGWLSLLNFEEKQ